MATNIVPATTADRVVSNKSNKRARIDTSVASLTNVELSLSSSQHIAQSITHSSVTPNTIATIHGALPVSTQSASAEEVIAANILTTLSLPNSTRATTPADKSSSAPSAPIVTPPSTVILSDIPRDLKLHKSVVNKMQQQYDRAVTHPMPVIEFDQIANIVGDKLEFIKTGI